MSCAPPAVSHDEQQSYSGHRKLERVFGQDIWSTVLGRTVLDYGCGEGNEAIALAMRGAGRVIGVDVRDQVLQRAAEAAERAGVGERCSFQKYLPDSADVILSCDSFEHYDDPASVLETMSRVLGPGGTVWISFGPPWFHPSGGHLFSVFPWAHLMFSEYALIKWRSDFKNDGATRFCEVDGGLNQMTVRRFRRLLQRGSLQIESFEAVPIRPLRWVANRLTREFVTSIVRCKLRRGDEP